MGVSYVVTMEDIKFIKNLPYYSQEYEEVYYDLLDDLRNNIVYVEFIKKNGELREMYCTRHPKYIEAFYEGSKKDGNAESEQSVIKRDMKNRIVRVFDMDKNEFRSFSIDSLVCIEIDSELP